MAEDIPNAINSAVLNDEDGKIMRYGHLYWREEAKNYSNEDLISLIRCLTIIEGTGNKYWLSGSVSPVIYLFEQLRKVEPSKEMEIGNWI